MKVLLFGIAVFCCLASVAWADAPISPYAYVAASEDGKCFASVVPVLADESDWRVILRKPYIAINKFRKDGAFKEVWRIENFYSFRVFVTNNARFLVALRPLYWEGKPSPEKVAVSFFREGKLIQEFSPADLVVDPKKTWFSENRYDWQDHSDRQYPRLKDYLFEIKTADGGIVRFQISDSEVTMTKEPKRNSGSWMNWLLGYPERE